MSSFRILFLIVALCLAWPSRAAVSLIAHNSCGSAGANTGCTTSATNTAGSTLEVVVISAYNAACSVNTSLTQPTDSLTNMWTLVANYGAGAANAYECMFYVENPSVGASQTFSCVTNSNASYCSLAVETFSGTLTVSSFDQHNGASSASSSSQATGSVTPGAANEVVVTGTAFFTNAVNSTPSGYTKTDEVAYSAGNRLAVAIGYQIQTTATATNPSWGFGGANSVGAGVATFKASGGGGATTATPSLMTMGVGD